MSEAIKPCPGCGSESTRVIGGPGTAGGPKHWAGCDHCRWRTWGNTAAEAIANWNTRHTESPLGPVADELERRADGLFEQAQIVAARNKPPYLSKAAAFRTAAALVRQSSPATAREVEELRAEVERLREALAMAHTQMSRARVRLEALASKGEAA